MDSGRVPNIDKMVNIAKINFPSFDQAIRFGNVLSSTGNALFPFRNASFPLRNAPLTAGYASLP